ncbi:ribonucleoside-diphosphate reductase subunit alpha [Candidatus Woesearchaeota archaeon]|nr:ribonucleoside-diphosphate reductase subunit alpha [Candidatus Woesearchaeota archaeon]
MTMQETVSMFITKRNGEVVPFNPDKIRDAILKAVKAANKTLDSNLLMQIVQAISEEIGGRFSDFFPNVENVQDIVEKHLVKSGLYEIAKEYILYRAQRMKEREQEKAATLERAKLGKLTVRKKNGTIALFDLKKIRATVLRACEGFELDVDPDLIVREVVRNVFDGADTKDIEKAVILAAISFIEKDPAYNYVSARIFLQKLYKEVIGSSTDDSTLASSYRDAFVKGIKKGVEAGVLDSRMAGFDLEKLSAGLQPGRDHLFKYIGLQTLYERYFLKIRDQRIELPQAFWMRVAMGLALLEDDKEARALEFYEAISSMRFVPSTPTLFHSGSTHPQLSSCYLTTIEDDLGHIFKCIADNAQLSKWSGGLGNDWTNIRATGSWIKSTNVESQGVIPFLKIANDVTMAINRSGKRRGATCAYLETWHLDIEDFLDLRRNTGDDRRRTHDMNTSNWIPDLFMKRVLSSADWTLFSPDEVPDLHNLYGKKFEQRYQAYEDMAKKGMIRKFKAIPAVSLWRKMLTRLFETGHPWITFKDPCNIRSPQDHCGVVHSSNLCTEITLNTSKDETAVCNLGSINLEKFIVQGKVTVELLAATVKVAMRMLDNVIDLNYYPTAEARNSNLRHRPVGLGIMGMADALFKLDIGCDSPATLEFFDSIMETISYHAILASSQLAKERGAFQSYKGSKWDRGIFPIDTLDILEQERGITVEVERSSKLDWTPVREQVKADGMRNSNCMAVAPTATISNIAGTYPCIEPIYKNIYVKSNISGEFTVVNEYLVEDLKKLGIWNNEMLEQLKYYDGNLQFITSIPQKLKEKYKEAFEIDPVWLLRLTAASGKWIDQSQSHNVFLKGSSGTKLNEVYISAWKLGLKTTYYLRTLAASQIEKSTLDAGKYGFTQKREYAPKGENGQSLKVEGAPAQEIVPMNGASHGTIPTVHPNGKTEICKLNDPDCEACQ